MYDGMVRPREVGHNIYILCHQLAQQHNRSLPHAAPLNILTSADFDLLASKAAVSSLAESYVKSASALRYYESHTAQIEIVRDNRTLERITFPVPQICGYLTHETKTHVYQNSEQDERGSKIPAFFQLVDDLFDEMNWQRELQTKPLLYSISRHMSFWSSIEFELSCLVSFLVILSTNAPQHDAASKQPETMLVQNDTAAASDVIDSSELGHRLIITFIAMFGSTLLVLRPRIAHFWSLLLICITLLMIDTIGMKGTLKLLGFLLHTEFSGPE